VLLAVLGGLVGGFLGLLVQSEIPRLLGDVLPARDIPFWQPRALARGVLLGTATSILFALPPLAAVLRVPPLRALRRSAEPLPPSRWVRAATALALFAGLVLLAHAQSGEWRLAFGFSGALVGTIAALALAGWLLRRAAIALARLPRPLLLRHGAALLARPAGEALPALVALGVGVLVVLAATLVERHLTGALDAELPKASPSAFLIDIQPDQWAGVEGVLRSEGASAIESVPVVMARLRAIDGVPVEQLAARARPGEERQAGEARERRWALTREQRLTYLPDLPPDNELVAGELWGDPEVAEVSLEQEYAAELGARLGSRLTFDVQGVPVEVTVTSLRAVDWRTFRINFFVVAEPGVLEEAPQSRLAAARLPHGREARIQGLIAQSWPNVTLVDVRDVLGKVTAVFQRLGLGVRFLGGFTAAAGLAILFGAVAAGAVRRARDVALLKTLGFTRWGVAALFTIEQALAGTVAGLLGVAGGALLARQIVVRQMELEWRLLPGTLGSALAVAVALTLFAGLAASARALRQRPIEALREERE
jgi:putative ABC transport system permease protein